MRIDGVILPNSESAEFTRETWCNFVASRPEFTRPSPKEGTNPFTGETMAFIPTEDVADLEVDGRVVGHVYWSMSEEPLVNVSIESSELHRVAEWATAMNGRFQADQ